MIEETAFYGLPPAPNNPNYLSLSLKVRRSSPLNISCGLLWTHSDRSVSFMHRKPHSWKQHCKWGLTLVKQRGRFTLLPMLVGSLGCNHTLPTHVQFFIFQDPEVPL